MDPCSTNALPDPCSGVDLSVIAPCFNEEGNIDALADRMLATFDARDIPAELVLVDDASSDGTWPCISRRADSDPRVRGCRHAVNRGIVGGWHTGLEASAGRLVCLIDADLQNRPEDVARLYAAYAGGGCDIVQAVRRPADGVRRLQLFSRGLNFLLNFAFRTRLRDNKSGFILCRRDVLAAILRHRYRYRYFQSFLGVSAVARGFTIRELDTTFEPRRHGQSFLSAFPLLVSARIVWELLKFRLESAAHRATTAADDADWAVPALLADTAPGES